MCRSEKKSTCQFKSWRGVTKKGGGINHHISNSFVKNACPENNIELYEHHPPQGLFEARRGSSFRGIKEEESITRTRTLLLDNVYPETIIELYEDHPPQGLSEARRVMEVSLNVSF